MGTGWENLTNFKLLDQRSEQENAIPFSNPPKIFGTSKQNFGQIKSIL